MQGLILSGAVGAGIYAVVAILAVVGSRFFGGAVWVPAVTYVGPAAYFICMATMNRSAFPNIETPALRWAALVTACGVLTAVSAFLVFVLAVNVHLGLEGHL